jgi:hypothetical protein
LLINLIICIIVPRHDKDTETLSKALYYSKKAYEEALAAIHATQIIFDDTKIIYGI